MRKAMSVKILLSAVSDEFRAYRDQLRGDLTRHNVEVKVQEDFKDFGVVTLDKLDLYIANCDAVVHLVGDMTGAVANPASTQAILAKYPDLADKLPPLREPLANGSAISYTQWEAWLALYHGKALLIAKAADAAPRCPSYAPTDASRAAQRAHLDQLRTVERYPGFTFASPDNLAKQIAYTTILDLLAETYGTRADAPEPASGGIGGKGGGAKVGGSGIAVGGPGGPAGRYGVGGEGGSAEVGGDGIAAGGAGGSAGDDGKGARQVWLRGLSKNDGTSCRSRLKTVWAWWSDARP
jgi:hypothetical protein